MKKVFKGFIFCLIGIILGATTSLIGCNIQRKLIIKEFGYYLHNVSIEHYSLILIEVGVGLMVSSVIIYLIYVVNDIMNEMKEL